MSDLSISLKEGRFNHRVGAIILKDNKVLMVSNDKSDHYYSVGGRVKFGESTLDALKRELVEELGIELEIDRLTHIHEVFFEHPPSKELFHELSFFYLVNLKEDQDIECSSFHESGQVEYLEWLDIDKLNDYELYPHFFKTDLNNLPKTTVHYIEKDYE